jgi:hypothetical protein
MKLIKKVTMSDWLDEDFTLYFDQSLFCNSDWEMALHLLNNDYCYLSSALVPSIQDSNNDLTLKNWISSLKRNSLTKKQMKALEELEQEIVNTDAICESTLTYDIYYTEFPSFLQAEREFLPEKIIKLENTEGRKYFAHQLRHGTLTSGECGAMVPDHTILLNKTGCYSSKNKTRHEDFIDTLNLFGVIYNEEIEVGSVPFLDPPQFSPAWITENFIKLESKYQELFNLVQESTGLYNLIMSKKDLIESNLKLETYVEISKIHMLNPGKSIFSVLVENDIPVTLESIHSFVSQLPEASQEYFHNLIDDSRLATKWALSTSDGTLVGYTKDPRIAEDWTKAKHTMANFPSKRGRVKVPLSIISMCVPNKVKDTLIGEIVSSSEYPYEDENFNSYKFLKLRSQDFYDNAYEAYLINLIKSCDFTTVNKIESKVDSYIGTYLNEVPFTASQLHYLRACLKQLGSKIIDSRKIFLTNEHSLYYNLFQKLSKKVYSYVNYYTFHEKEINPELFARLVSGEVDIFYKFTDPNDYSVSISDFDSLNKLTFTPKFVIYFHCPSMTAVDTFNVIRNYKIQPSIIKLLEENASTLCPSYNLLSSVSHQKKDQD